jgi:hypothetical protein
MYREKSGNPGKKDNSAPQTDSNTGHLDWHSKKAQSI